MTKDLLLIFIKNPILGKAKTRLAATIGQEKALQVYELLLARTHAITQQLPAQKALYYADFLEPEDIWENNIYQKFVQKGSDLGERMLEAFATGFAAGYERICIIGSDCFELADEIIEEAFEKLNAVDLVVGPSLDGGYYLLGMKALHPELFQEKKWSTDSVLRDTLADAKKLNLKFSLLPTLSDVDEEKDLISIDDLFWD